MKRFIDHPPVLPWQKNLRLYETAEELVERQLAEDALARLSTRALAYELIRRLEVAEKELAHNVLSRPD